jgi:hypothetical protein
MQRYNAATPRFHGISKDLLQSDTIPDVFKTRDKAMLEVLLWAAVPKVGQLECS